MKIDLLIVATSKYITFLPKLISSVKKHFLTDCEVVIHVFTNRMEAVELLLSQEDAIIKPHHVDHKPWPHATLKRFHFFKRYIDEITGHYVFYIDADTIIMDKIDLDILSPRTVVAHCGFVNGGGSWEERKESRAYTPKSIQKTYYGGGFWGFDRSNFQVIVDRAVEMIDEDEANGIIPVWHDESVLNAIMASMEPTKILSPSCHWPQNNKLIWDSWKENYECKILLLDKNHKEFQI